LATLHGGTNAAHTGQTSKTMAISCACRSRFAARRTSQIDACTHWTAAKVFGARFTGLQKGATELTIAPITLFADGPHLNTRAAGTAHHCGRAHAISAKEVFGAIANAAIIGARLVDITLSFTFAPSQVAK